MVCALVATGPCEVIQDASTPALNPDGSPMLDFIGNPIFFPDGGGLGGCAAPKILTADSDVIPPLGAVVVGDEDSFTITWDTSVSYTDQLVILVYRSLLAGPMERRIVAERNTGTITVAGLNPEEFYKWWIRVENYEGSLETSLGSDRVTNGTFDADTDWTKTGSWAIAGGVASAGGSNGFLTQTSIFEVGKTYEFTFDVLDFTSGIVQIGFQGGTFGEWRTANGTYTEIIVADSIHLAVNAFATPVLSIDNVSVKEIVPPATPATGPFYHTAWEYGEVNTGINSLNFIDPENSQYLGAIL